MKIPLSQVKVASPCSANWNEMSGDEQRRFCGACQLHVYNISEMTRSEAERFLGEAEGHVCVRFYRRTDGTIMTQDCPVGMARVKRRVLGLVGGGVACLLTGLTTIAAQFGNGHMVDDLKTAGRKVEPIRRVIDLVSPPPSVTMGAIACPPPITGKVAVSPKKP